MKSLKTAFLYVIVAVVVLYLASSLHPTSTTHAEQKVVSTLQKLTTPSHVDYETMAKQDAVAAGIEPNVFVRQINQESGFQTEVVSSAGAIGIAQFMPQTAKGLGIDPHDPIASLKAAALLMASYVKEYGSYAKALACYNAGCHAVYVALSICEARYNDCSQRWMDYLPAETQNYVHVILGGTA